LIRTIKLKLNYDEVLKNTAILYNQACQTVLDYGFKNKTYHSNKLNTGTYNQIRKEIPQLPSGLVQTARDQASDMLKRDKCKILPTRKKLQIRYDKRTFKFFPNGQYISVSTIKGRLCYRVKIYDYCRQYLNGQFTNSQLIIRRNKIFMNIQVRLDDIKTKLGNKILGIDRGITNIVTCSDNTFYNSRHQRKVKGNYQYLRSKLQSVGTRSAKQKLRKISGRERRFTLDLNHRLAKEIASKDYDVFVVEKLTHIRKRTERKYGQKFNKKLGNWSFSQFLIFLKYKAESLGKTVIEIDPKYTSQQCSKCGFISKENRYMSRFKCLGCGFELNADLNAARNIGQLGRSELIRLSVNQPDITVFNN
jgi:IS605 OrfB family transposase